MESVFQSAETAFDVEAARRKARNEADAKRAVEIEEGGVEE